MKPPVIVIPKGDIPEMEICLFDICRLSEMSDMTTLSVGKILDEHQAGYARVAVAEQEDGEYVPLGAVGYAGYTKDREHNGLLYAQIGGIVALPAFRGGGNTRRLVQKLYNVPLSDEYAGFAAVSNPLSHGMLISLGMTQIDMVPSESTGELHPLLTISRSQALDFAVE